MRGAVGPNRGSLRHAVALVLAAAAPLAPVDLPAEDRDSRPGREILLPRSQVWDTFLGYVIGLMRSDRSARVDLPYLLDLLPEVKASAGLKRIRAVGWSSGAMGRPELSFWFDGELHYPIPLSILWYHPGSIDASSEIILRETDRGHGSGAFSGPYHFLVVQRGFARVTFDPWLDALAGTLLDTFALEAVALVTYHGEWHAILAGRGLHDQTVPWTVNLARNKVRFPAPRELVAVADRLLATGSAAIIADESAAAGRTDSGRDVP